MSATPGTLLLVDGSSFLFRAFHAMPSLSNSRGEPTGAAYGVINMLRGLLLEQQPDRVAVVFDARGPTFRHTLYPGYKANRPPMAEELAGQIEPTHAMVRALGLPLLAEPGVEADDVIGTLAEHGREAGYTVLIVTSDKDLAQLVGDRVTLLRPENHGYLALDADAVAHKYGVAPPRMVDLLALTGDSVDNVPGVPKVGPKTAAKWLASYDSLDGVIAHAAEIPGKVGENLRASLDQLELSRKLVTIRRDVPLAVGVADLVRGETDRPRLAELYRRLEFRSWLDALGEDPPADRSTETAERPPTHYETVLDAQRFGEWLERLAGAPLFAFDTETTSLDYMRAELVGVSFAVAPDEAAYVPCGHCYPGAPAQIGCDELLAALRPLLEDAGRDKVGQNLKYDMSVLARYGVTLRGVRHDTMLESYVLDSTATRHDMDSLAQRYLQRETIHYEDVAGKGAKHIGFAQVPLESAGPYAAEDADVTLALHRTLWPRLSAEEGLRRLYETIEMPLVPVLSRIERTGVRVDAAMLETQGRELAARMHETAENAYRAAGQRFNLGSPKQIQGILFERLELPVRAKTPSGQPSTTESVLQELADEHPLPGLILEHRALAKLKSTYTDALPACINPDTGRVHTSYHQAVASTGRLSSSDPNLQNIPVRTEEGRRIRQAFIAEPGHVLMAADYSQIELRIMAHLSGDAGLTAAFAAGADVHTATAAEVFGVDPGAVDGEQRRRAKAINFGLIYGMSAFGLARQLGIGQKEAQAYVDLYFSRYPDVKRFMDETRSSARERGFVETVFGRRLHLRDIKSRNAQRRQYAERTAINAPMQGSAADIIKRVMIEVDGWLADQGDGARMTMQVHDELVLEVPEDRVAETRARLDEIMCGAASLNVPLVVDIGVGANWDEAH